MLEVQLYLLLLLVLAQVGEVGVVVDDDGPLLLHGVVPLLGSLLGCPPPLWPPCSSVALLYPQSLSYYSLLHIYPSLDRSHLEMPWL